MNKPLLPATQKWMRYYDKQSSWVNSFFQKLASKKIRLDNIKPSEVEKLREVMRNQLAIVPADTAERQAYIDFTAYGKNLPTNMCLITMPDENFVYRLWRAALQENRDWAFVHDPQTGELTLMMVDVFAQPFPPKYRSLQAIIFDDDGKAQGWMNMADFTRSVEDQIWDEALEEHALRQDLQFSPRSLPAVSEAVASHTDRTELLERQLEQIRQDVAQLSQLAKRQGVSMSIFDEIFGPRAAQLGDPELALWNAADAVDEAAKKQQEANANMTRLLTSIEAAGFLPGKEDEAQAELYFSRPFKSTGGAGLRPSKLRALSEVPPDWMPRRKAGFHFFTDVVARIADPHDPEEVELDPADLRRTWDEMSDEDREYYINQAIRQGYLHALTDPRDLVSK